MCLALQIVHCIALNGSVWTWERSFFSFSFSLQKKKKLHSFEWTPKASSKCKCKFKTNGTKAHSPADQVFFFLREHSKVCIQITSFSKHFFPLFCLLVSKWWSSFILMHSFDYLALNTTFFSSVFLCVFLRFSLSALFFFLSSSRLFLVLHFYGANSRIVLHFYCCSHASSHESASFLPFIICIYRYCRIRWMRCHFKLLSFRCWIALIHRFGLFCVSYHSKRAQCHVSTSFLIFVVVVFHVLPFRFTFLHPPSALSIWLSLSLSLSLAMSQTRVNFLYF